MFFLRKLIFFLLRRAHRRQSSRFTTPVTHFNRRLFTLFIFDFSGNDSIYPRLSPKINQSISLPSTLRVGPGARLSAPSSKLRAALRAGRGCRSRIRTAKDLRQRPPFWTMCRLWTLTRHVYQETCPRPKRRIRTLRRRQLALGQTITGHLTHRAPTGALRNTQSPLMAPLAGQTLLTFGVGWYDIGYANIVPAHASGTERRRSIEKVVGRSASRWSGGVHARTSTGYTHYPC